MSELLELVLLFIAVMILSSIWVPWADKAIDQHIENQISVDKDTTNSEGGA